MLSSAIYISNLQHVIYQHTDFQNKLQKCGTSTAYQQLNRNKEDRSRPSEPDKNNVELPILSIRYGVSPPYQSKTMAKGRNVPYMARRILFLRRKPPSRHKPSTDYQYKVLWDTPTLIETCCSVAQLLYKLSTETCSLNFSRQPFLT